MTDEDGLLSSDPQARVRAVEDAWNRREMDLLLRSHRIDCQWRERAEFLWGREQIRAFLTRKWRREMEFRLLTDLWACQGARMAVRLACEFRTDSGTWFRAFGNESWDYDDQGLIGRHLSSINEHPISEHERVLRWPAGIRPVGHPTLEELGF